MITVYLEDSIDVLGAALALVAIVLHRVTGSSIPDALGSIIIGCLLCYVALRLTSQNRRLLSNQSVPDRYVERLRTRLVADDAISAVPRLEAVYLGPGQVLAAADVELSAGLSGLTWPRPSRVRARRSMNEVPAIARLYLTPVPAAVSDAQ